MKIQKKINRNVLCILLFVFLFSIDITVAQNNNALMIGNIKADPGQKVSDSLHIKKGVDNETFIPITIINGVKQGPVLTLIAGIHGTEYVPIIVLQKLISKIDPNDLSGTLILVHVASVESFQKRTMYFNPVDFKNVNRFFPGNESGTQSERIAYTITHEIIDKSDYLIDMHGGESNECYVNFAFYYHNCPDRKVYEGSYLLAKSFGFNYLYAEDYNFIPDSLSSMYCDLTAVRRGVSTIAIELGDRGIVDTDEVNFGVEGIINVMKALNMLKGKMADFKNLIHLSNLNVVNSNHQGIFYSEVACGQIVSKGMLLGYTTDYLGNRIEEFYAPIAGIIILAISTPPVNKGENVFWLMEITDEIKK